MKIIKAKVLGFCMGVRRAVELATEEAKLAAANGTSVFTLGPLIHNPVVLDDLKTLGIKIINDTNIPSNCSVIIRTHGICPKEEKKLFEKKTRVIDVTCPKVKKSQLKTQELVREGYFLFLAGEEKHAEITGLIGYANIDGDNKNYIVIGNTTEAEKAAFELLKTNKKIKTALLGQTTISQDEYACIGETIKKYFSNLKIIDTICAATSERQNALREILPLLNAVIVAGGNDSANTRRLFAIAKESGKPCVLVERAEDIPQDFFGYETVGICAGASTPDSVVEEIERRILSSAD